MDFSKYFEQGGMGEDSKDNQQAVLEKSLKASSIGYDLDDPQTLFYNQSELMLQLSKSKRPPNKGVKLNALEEYLRVMESGFLDIVDSYKSSKLKVLIIFFRAYINFRAILRKRGKTRFSAGRFSSFSRFSAGRFSCFSRFSAGPLSGFPAGRLSGFPAGSDRLALS